MRWPAVALVCLAPAVAEAARVELRAEPDTLREGQSGRAIVLVIGGAAEVQVGSPPTLPAGDGLDAAFVGQAHQFRVVNGQITNLLQFEYRLSALEEGTWSLGPVELAHADGSPLVSKEIQVEVLPRGVPDAEAAPIEVEAGFDRDEAWEGQVVLYRHRLESRIPAVSAEWRLPDLEGLRQPQHGQPDLRSYTITDPDGAIVVEEGVVPLVATGTGTREYSPAIAQVRVPSGRPNLLGFRQYSTETFASERASLTVRPLPEPRPASFGGLVGDFEVRARIDDASVAVGESVPWTLFVEGDGTLEGFSLPAYEVEGARVYDNESTVGGRIEDEAWVAQGVFRRVLVPTRPGTLDLPDLEITSFSPSRGEYVTATVELPTLQVTPGREGEAEVKSFGAVAPTEGEGVVLDFRGVYASGRASAPFLGGLLPWMLGAAALPGGAVGVVELWQLSLARRRRRRAARERPLEGSDLLRDLPTGREERLAALDAALRLALARREGVDVAALDRPAAVARLPESLRDRVEAVSRSLDRARFADGPLHDDPAAEVRAVVDLLERR